MNASASGERFSPENLLYDGASRVIHSEIEHIKKWRGQEPCVGLALSGGGIRSATYCLGVLQALAYRRALPQVDYLSTVSGGGYIGVSLAYLLHQSSHGAQAVDGVVVPKFDVSRENFPYVSYPMVGVVGKLSEQEDAASKSVPDAQVRENEKFKGRLVRRLRQSTNYLAPGDGITLLSLSGVVLRNLAVSLVVHVAVLVVLFQMLYAYRDPIMASQIRSHEVSGFPNANAYLYAAMAVVMVYGLLSMLYVFCTRVFDRMERNGLRLSYQIRRSYEVSLNYLFLAALLLVVIGGLPWIYELIETMHPGDLRDWLPMQGIAGQPDAAGADWIATLIGIIGNVWGFMQARSGQKHRIPTGLVVGVASALLAIGLLLLVFMLTGWLHRNQSLGGSWGILALALAVLLTFGWWPEANYVSLHRYYRDRLMELFLPDLKAVGDSMMNTSNPKPTGLQAGDATLLGELCQIPGDGRSANKLRGPYPIINANVVLTASKHPRYRARGGDNFILSPLYCGSRATDWQPTDCTHGSGFTLATAMAISGAAVNPNAGPGGEGVTRQPVLSVLMGMLNLRLGYWATNLNHAPTASGHHRQIPWFRPNQLFPGLAESFGRFFLNEHARFSLLTDGGHFENLGLYELVRRRLKLIIVCDASADPNFNFSDLANAIQKVRADFGAIIDISDEQLATLMPRQMAETDKATPSSGSALQGYLIACIRYATKVGQSPETGREVGTLILLKATAFSGSPADVFSYRREHPEFPNQSTADQFYDEKQFDSYRELGYVTADRMLKEIEASRLEPGNEHQLSNGYIAPTRHQIAGLLFGLPEPTPSNA